MEISKRVEKFIEENTRNYSNLARFRDINRNVWEEKTPWLTPGEARTAVEIAREEIIDKTLDFLKDKLYESGYIGIMDLCDEYIKAMKDEEGRR